MASDNLARVGRRLDREIDRIIGFLDDEVRPTAQRGSVRLLRQAARKLDRLAATISGPKTRAKVRTSAKRPSVPRRRSRKR